MSQEESSGSSFRDLLQGARREHKVAERTTDQENRGLEKEDNQTRWNVYRLSFQEYLDGTEREPGLQDRFPGIDEKLAVAISSARAARQPVGSR